MNLVIRRTLKCLMLLIATCFTNGCATTNQQARVDWEAVRSSDAFAREKQTYRGRIGNKDFCWDVGVDEFLMGTRSPSSNCIYPSSKLIVEDDGMLSENKILRQATSQLEVMQVTATGFVVRRSDHSTPAIIFVQKSDEVGLVDGSHLDDASWTMYEYEGPFTYETIVGTKTVHSFKKVIKDRFANARAGLKNYDPKIELSNR